MNLYYCYRHIRLDKNQVFYIGIGTNTTHNPGYRRARNEHKRSLHWRRITEKTKWEAEIIYECNSLKEIREKEKEFIKIYGRSDLNLGTLCNHTDGGEGVANPSKESKAKEYQSKIKNGTLHFGDKNSSRRPEVRTKMSEAKNKRPLGTKSSDEAKRKISETAKKAHAEEKAKGIIRKTRNGLHTKWQKILKYSLTNELIAEYKSVRNAAMQNNVHESTIKNSIRLNKPLHDFIWKLK